MGSSVLFRDEDGERIEARVLETEVNLNWVWLRVDDGTAEGRWVRSDVVESFRVLCDEDEPLGPTIGADCTQRTTDADQPE